MGAKTGNEEPVRSVRSVEDINALSATTDSILVERLDDAKARALGRLRQLRVLYQDGSPVGLTDKGVQALAELPSLEVLDLEWAQAVTDHALAALHSMPRLRWVDLGGCSQISEAAIQDLRRANPQLEIER
jgi:hypothetical protein